MHSRLRMDGFTLLEVLVAFAILAVSLGVIYQLFGQGTRASSASSRYTQAMILAQSMIAEAGVGWKLEPGIQQGKDNRGYLWQIEIRPYADIPHQQLEDMPEAFQITVQVGWDGSHEKVRLDSILLDEGS